PAFSIILTLHAPESPKGRLLGGAAYTGEPPFLQAAPKDPGSFCPFQLSRLESHISHVQHRRGTSSSEGLMARQSSKKKRMQEKTGIRPEFVKAEFVKTAAAKPELGPAPAAEKATAKMADGGYRLTDANVFGRNMARVAVK